VTGPRTLPQALQQAAAEWPERPALREKVLGIWAPTTWRRYQERVKHFALGLSALGAERGVRVAILGTNRPEWLVADLAAQSLGGAGVGLFVESLPEEVAYVINHCDATVVVVEDQEQVDKILEVRDRLEKVTHVIYDDPQGMNGYDDPLLIAFTDVERLGAELDAAEPGRYDAEVALGRPDDVAVLLYTSGTTGAPKGAMLSHRNMAAAIEQFLAVEPVEPSFELVSHLPMAWAGERLWSTAGHVLKGYRVNFPESKETIRGDIREIGPHHIFASPAMWEEYLSTVEISVGDATRLKRALYRWALPIGHARAERMYRGESAGLRDRLVTALADLLVFRPLRDQLGLLRAARIYSGGAALGPDVFRWYHAIGIPMKQVYGQTEVGIVSVHWDQIKPDTMGKPVPGASMRTGDDGEILIAGDSVFLGYYKDDAATARAVKDGWLHTGDEGHFDQSGHLVVVDRMKDVAKLRSGQRFSPAFVENKLKFSPYVKEAVAFGDGRDHVVALVNVDGKSVGKWAEQHGISFTTYADLTQRAEVLELIRSEVTRVNRDVPEANAIVRFCVLHKELDADDGEVTRTRKVKRSLVSQRYGFIVEAMYAGEVLVPVEAEVTYRDGRQAVVKTELHIVDPRVTPLEAIA
jgi:long-chain acyl-CoA synthetase